MKRNQQGEWLITGIITVVVTAIVLILMALFAIANVNPLGNSVAITNMALTSNLFESQSSQDSTSQEDDKPSKEPESVFLMQAVSLSNVNDNTIGARQDTPAWEKSLLIDEPLPILNFFTPVSVIRVFAMFYRLARTGAEDDLPDR
jgi:hypothetical protein